jgi:UvrD-like helicase C-terminal domain
MLVPAYAVTIHKSQASEYPAVVIPVMTQHYAMLQRNLFYTGITRGKKLVVSIGQKKAVAIVAIAVRNVSGWRRWSKLSEWLPPPNEVPAASRPVACDSEVASTQLSTDTMSRAAIRCLRLCRPQHR